MSDTNSGSAFKKIANDSGSKKLLGFIAVAFIGVGAYFVFAPEVEAPIDSRVRKVPVGGGSVLGGEVNPAYEAALREADRQRIEEAQKTGASAIPSVVGNRTQEQIPLTIETPTTTPEVIRPQLPEIKPIAPVEKPQPLPEPKPLPEVKRPVIQPPPVQQPPMPQPVATTPPPAPQPQKPQVDTELLQAYQRQLSGIMATMDKVPSEAKTTYFYEPPAEESSATNASGASSNVASASSALTIQSPVVAPSASANVDASGEELKFPLPGQILYAQLINRANSDAPGPVLARVLQGDYAGSTVIGSFTVANEALIIEFTSITIMETVDGRKVEKNVPIRAVAVDTKYIGTALATKVDRHMFERVAVTFATAFAGSLGEIIKGSGGTTVVNPDGSSVTQNTTLKTRDQLVAAGGEAVGEVGNIISDFYGSKPTTVIVETGTPIGLLFL